MDENDNTLNADARNLDDIVRAAAAIAVPPLPETPCKPCNRCQATGVFGANDKSGLSASAGGQCFACGGTGERPVKALQHSKEAVQAHRQAWRKAAYAAALEATEGFDFGDASRDGRRKANRVRRELEAWAAGAAR